MMKFRISPFAFVLFCLFVLHLSLYGFYKKETVLEPICDWHRCDNNKQDRYPRTRSQ